MPGKRELVEEALSRSGVEWLLEPLPQRQSLLVLTFHRIGNAQETDYDSGVFSATAEQFDAVIAFLKLRFRFATLEEAVRLASGAAPLGDRVLLTFDDGYRDNYTLAYPILRSHGVPAAFFLPTAFVGTGLLPWWDAIAFVVKKSRKRQFQLSYPETANFDLEAEGAEREVVRVLKLFKQPTMDDPERFISTLEQVCEVRRPGQAERLFLNWEEAREMQGHGMEFGSHTHTHPILSKLPFQEQKDELLLSRQILERELGRPVDAFAYPVGLRNTFSQSTVEALKQSGYQAAFSFYGGLNLPHQTDAFDLKRHGISAYPPPMPRCPAA